MYKDFYLSPNDINISKNKECSRKSLSFHSKLNFKYLDILEKDKKNNLIVKKNIDVFSFNKKESYKKFLQVYKDLDLRINNIISNKTFHKLLPKKNPLIMGILNVTKDSFYDGGKYFKYRKALNYAEKMILEGADIIDIGGESTRPGAVLVKPKEEIKRVLPLIKKLSKNNILVSCDTRNSLTMKAALDAGASIINDVSGFNYDEKTLDVIKEYKCLYILMHSKGTPDIMQNNPIYKNVTCDIYSFFKKKILTLRKKNISMNNIILDPGIGFGKTDAHNFSILANLGIFLDLGFPILIGASRKSLIQRFIKENKDRTLTGSVAIALNAYLKGANILRVHDVKETIDSINLFKRIGI